MQHPEGPSTPAGPRRAPRRGAGKGAGRRSARIAGDLEPIARAELAVDPLRAAQRLLNAVLCVGERAGRIVEVEAYDGARDPASHAYRGRTARNATMFGDAGLLYVYLSYGLHCCANVVCREDGDAGAVLLRAIEPLEGIDQMWADTPVSLAEHQLGSGPGRLCRAMGITRGHDGVDLVARGAPARLYRDGVQSPRSPLVGPRVGLSPRCGEALEWAWRFAVPGNAAVSRPLPPEAKKSGAGLTSSGQRG